MRPYEYPPNPGLPGTKKGGVNIPTAPPREDAARATGRLINGKKPFCPFTPGLDDMVELINNKQWGVNAT